MSPEERLARLVSALADVTQREAELVAEDVTASPGRAPAVGSSCSFDAAVIPLLGLLREKSAELRALVEQRSRGRGRR